MVVFILESKNNIGRVGNSVPINRSADVLAELFGTHTCHYVVEFFLEVFTMDLNRIVEMTEIRLPDGASQICAELFAPAERKRNG